MWSKIKEKCKEKWNRKGRKGESSDRNHFSYLIFTLFCASWQASYSLGQRGNSKHRKNRGWTQHRHLLINNKRFLSFVRERWPEEQHDWWWIEGFQYEIKVQFFIRTVKGERSQWTKEHELKSAWCRVECVVEQSLKHRENEWIEDKKKEKVTLQNLCAGDKQNEQEREKAKLGCRCVIDRETDNGHSCDRMCSDWKNEREARLGTQEK